MTKKKTDNDGLNIEKLKSVKICGRVYKILWLEEAIAITGEMKSFIDNMEVVESAVKDGKLGKNANGDITIPLCRGLLMDEIRTIMVRQTSSDDFNREVLMHEIIHGILSAVRKIEPEEGLSIQSDEDLIHSISEPLRITIQENPEFFKELFNLK